MKRRPDAVIEKSDVAPFSRLLAVDEIREDGLDMAIEADHAERDTVAKDIGLPSVKALAADFRIARMPANRLQVDGKVAAKIVQVCVVSLEPFESEVLQPVNLVFAPAAPTAADLGVPARHLSPVSRRRRDEPPSPPPSAEVGEDDPPDPIVDGKIDLGAVAVEFLTLGLDFYPRKPGVRFDASAVAETDAPQATAFAVLERLKDRS